MSGNEARLNALTDELERAEAVNARLAQTVEELRSLIRADHIVLALKGITTNPCPCKICSASEPEAKTVTDQLGNRFHRLTASEPEAKQGE